MISFWPSWSQAALSAALCALVALLLRRSRPSRITAVVIDFATQFGVLAGLYSVWRLARQLPLTQPEGAIERARDIVRIQEWLHLPSELSVQSFVLDHDWLLWPINSYYGGMHIPSLLMFLGWLFVRQREHFVRWRNALCILTGFCLFIRFVRVAPPRFFPDLGYVDTATMLGISVYGPIGTGVSDQFAAMPSIHVGWAAVVSFGIVASSTSRWRWLFLGHVIITSLAVVATGNHWWLDGIVAMALLGVSLRIDTVSRRWLARRRIQRVAGASRVR